MSPSVIIVILVVLGAAIPLARLRFGLLRPAVFLIGLGVFGAIMTAVGIDVEIDPLDLNGGVRWLALSGILLSFGALLNLLGLILIWAIRRWWIRHDDTPRSAR